MKNTNRLRENPAYRVKWADSVLGLAWVLGMVVLAGAIVMRIVSAF